MNLNRESIRRRLPENLDELARETGALLRRREVKSAEQLLWMSLIYSGVVGSFRGASAMGARTGDFDMNDTSVRYRMMNSAGFLSEVLNHLLFGAARKLRDKGLGRRICLQDATVVSIPGSKGTDFRLHTEYIPNHGLSHVEITDNKGAESLERGEYNQGDVVMADRGLGKARSIHHVHSVGAFSLIRVCLQNLRLADEAGKKLEPNHILDVADQGNSSLTVYVPYEHNPPVQARLVIGRLPPEQAGRARQRLREQASKKQKVVGELALRLAGYVVLLTTVPQSELSDSEALTTYRLRWQIELFFKRCKSLLGLDKLAAKTPAVARTWLFGKMIIATLIDRAIEQIWELSTQSPGKPISLWRLTEFCFADLTAAIQHVENEHPTITADVLSRLKEGPRKRQTAESQVDQLHQRLNPRNS